MKQLILVSSGTGPAEVREFVARLTERIKRQCIAAELPLLSISFVGEAAAPRSATISVAGNAKEHLFGEMGTHLLVSRSAKRGVRSRKRWFASVRIIDACESQSDTVDEKDVTFSYCRAGGPGGQHVNKTNSAVHAVHKKSGIRVRASSMRNQQANKKAALAEIARRLLEQASSQRRHNKKQRRTSHYRLERGNPVRTYNSKQEV